MLGWFEVLSPKAETSLFRKCEIISMCNFEANMLLVYGSFDGALCYYSSSHASPPSSGSSKLIYSPLGVGL